MDMFHMVADKLILNWAEKNSFLCRCIGLLSITMWLIFLFPESSLFKMSAEENIIICVS